MPFQPSGALKLMESRGTRTKPIWMSPVSTSLLFEISLSIPAEVAITTSSAALSTTHPLIGFGLSPASSKQYVRSPEAAMAQPDPIKTLSEEAAAGLHVPRVPAELFGLSNGHSGIGGTFDDRVAMVGLA